VRFDDPEVREFLDRAMVLRMASLSPKGQPIIRCLWFVCQRGRIYTFTAELTPTGRSISVHPDVALLFDGERGPRTTRLLRLRGRAVYRRESGIVARVLLGLARKYFLTPPGLRNLLAHAKKVPLAVRFYAEPGLEVRGQGVGLITEVVPESFEFLPRSPGQAAS
jgi:hypothetical protein